MWPSLTDKLPHVTSRHFLLGGEGKPLLVDGGPFFLEGRVCVDGFRSFYLPVNVIYGEKER